MSKHTPGPWIAMEGGSMEGEMVITTEARIHLDMVSICDMDYVFDGEFGLEQEANAKLIAAAPELLEALDEMIAAFLAEYPAYEAGQAAQDAWSNRRAAAIDNSRAVVAKARGEA